LFFLKVNTHRKPLPAFYYVHYDFPIITKARTKNVAKEGNLYSE